MRKSIEEIAREAGTATNLDGLWSLIHEQLQVRGATSALVGVLASKRELDHQRLSRALIWKSSHKPEFFEAFRDEQLFDNDRTAAHCLSQSRLMFWHDPREWQHASPAQLKRNSIERDLGFSIGFTVPAAHFYPSQVGGIGVSLADVPLCDFDGYWKREGRELVTLCGLLDAGIRGSHMGEFVNLSTRERDCLVWLAVGLRPDRIANKMGVSEKAIEKYVLGARRKLKASTRDHAVAKAILLGVIDP